VQLPLSARCREERFFAWGKKIAEMISAICKMIPPIEKIISAICKTIPTICKIISAIYKMISAIDKIIPPICKMIPTIYKTISAICKMIPPICNTKLLQKGINKSKCNRHHRMTRYIRQICSLSVPF
jgi:hypothetical protein